MHTYKKYLWLIPTLYVSYQFGEKLFEVLADNQEFVDIVSVVSFLKPLAGFLSYAVGVWDILIAVLILINPFVFKSAKLQQSLFVWCMIWPFAPSSLRYFSGLAEFEIVNVVSMVGCAVIGYVLWKKFKG